MVMLASPKMFSRMQLRREPPPRQQQPFVFGFPLFGYYHLNPFLHLYELRIPSTLTFLLSTSSVLDWIGSD
jgi:hypothetical protein